MSSDEGPTCFNKIEFAFVGVLVATLILSAVAIYLVKDTIFKVIVSFSFHAIDALCII